MKINMYTEVERAGITTTGIVTGYKGLMEGLRDEGVDVTVNAKDGYDILHVHSFGPWSLFRARREKKPVVITTHTVPDEMSLLFRGGRYIQGIFEHYLTTVYNQADLLISPSNFAKNRVEKMGVKSKQVIESNGIHTHKFSRSLEKRKAFRKQHGISDDTTIVGCVGIPCNRKGLNVFIEVANHLPEVRFFWIGKNVYGRLMKDYRYLEQLKSDHPKNVSITGYVDDIQAAYSAMDVFFFPTMIETEGLVILEATCCDIPIVTSKIDGLLWVEDKTQCLKADTTNGYVQAINELRANPQKGKQLVDGAKQLTEQKDMRVVSKRIISLYESLL